jgi:hypothetical protein
MGEGAARRLRHRVIARGAERPAAQEPAGGQPQPAARTVDGQRLAGIAGTRRREPARRRTTLRRPLVAVDDPHPPSCRGHRLSHRAPPRTVTSARRRPTSSHSSAWVRPAAVGAAPTRSPPWSSGPEGAAAAATIARRRRRSRFRSTAEPTARPTENATRGGTSRGSSRYRHHSVSVWARRPRDSSRNSRRRRIRPIKRTVWCGPWPAAPSGSPGRRASACGRETRACGLAAECWVGRCASRQLLVGRGRRHGSTGRARHRATTSLTTAQHYRADGGARYEVGGGRSAVTGR